MGHETADGATAGHVVHTAEEWAVVEQRLARLDELEMAISMVGPLMASLANSGTAINGGFVHS